MREIRTSGSEGGEPGQPGFPTPIQGGPGCGWGGEFTVRAAMVSARAGRAVGAAVSSQCARRW